MDYECACTVPVDTDYGTSNITHDLHNAIALKQCECKECQRIINVGEHFCREYLEWCDGYYDEDEDEKPDNIEKELISTCDDCFSLRQVFFSSGWYYGVLWEDFTTMVDDVGGDISVTCIRQITTAARIKVLDIMDEYFKRNEDDE